MKKKSLLNLSIFLTFFFIIVLSFFLYIENLNFLYKKNNFFHNEIFSNSAVGDSFIFYHNIEDVNFKTYLNDIVRNLQIRKFYPGNTYNFQIFIQLFDKNIHLLYAFNLFFFLYFIYKFSFFFQKKKLIFYFILSSLNILILGSLSIPNKDILTYFSFTALLLYYLRRDYKLLFISFFFEAVSRHEILIINILVLIINSNFFLKINNFNQRCNNGE
jgi:hypothetical protein